MHAWRYHRTKPPGSGKHVYFRGRFTDCIGTRLNMNIKQHLAAVSAACVSVIVYVALFFATFKTAEAGASAFSFIPVCVIAALYGWKAGLAGGVMVTLSNTLLINIAFETSSIWAVVEHKGLPGSITLAISGAIIGYLRDLRIRLRNELRLKQIMQAKLDTTNEQMKRILDTAPSGIFTTDTSAGITSWNLTAEKITGLSAKAVIGKKCSEIWHCPSCLERCGLYDDSVAKPVYGLECPIRLADGREIVISKNIDVLHNPQGVVIGGIELFEDVTEKRKAREHIDKLQRAINQSGEGIAIADTEGIITYANHAWAHMHGYTAVELPGKHLSLFHSEQQLQKEVIPFNEKVMHNGHCSGEVGHKRKDGSTFQTYMSTTLLVDENKRPVGLIGAAQDITILKEAEEKLRESEKSFRALFNTSSEALHIIDMQSGTFLAVNPSMSEMFGYTERELLNLSPPDLAPPGDRKKQESALKIIIEEGGIRNFEGVRLRKDGTMFYALISSKVIFWRGKQVIYGSIRDITPQKELQFEMQKKNNEILQFARTISHDLKNPLAGLQGILDIVKMTYGDSLDEDVKDVVASGEQAIEYSLELLNELLDIAKIEAGEKVLQKRVIDLHELVEKVVERLKVQAAGNKVLLQNEVTGHINADPQEIGKVYMNLIGNALNYAANGHDAWVIAGVSHTPQGTELFVRDNGIGIPKESIPVVFDKFQRGANVGTLQGSGLGLAICKSIIEAHGGAIRVESQAGKGSTFYFTIPS
ncbi:MAG: PAS domain S-box protein [Chitinivibrionales bacterium]|nr:PAS domain S-box protein [Chitinivibrionales bacterium]